MTPKHVVSPQEMASKHTLEICEAIGRKNMKGKKKEIVYPDVGDIVKMWLKDNGYSGLCGEDCGCYIDDLMPCGECMDTCQAGYKVKCTEDCGHEMEGKPENNWHIQLNKEPK